MPLATRPPTRPSTRSAISRAALFVNVIDRIAPGEHAELADQVRDAVRQRAGLPRAGAGHDEDGPLRVEDGLGLDVVQAFEQGGADAHEPIVGASDDRPGRDAR